MAAANVKQQLEDITECPICFNIFTDPRVLPCVHTYCRKCIESFCIDKVKGDEIACPECRKNFTIPEGGVEKLPKHFIMTKLLEMKDLPIASPEVPPTVNSSDETCSRFPPSYCETHREKNLEIYCFNCKTVCCVTCLVDQHNGHKFTEVDKVSNELRAETTNHVKCLTGRIDKNRGRLKHLDDQKQRFADKVAEVEAEINERATQLHDLIERRRQAMLDELLEVRNGRVKEIDNLRNEVEQNTSMITSLENHVKRWNETGSACDIAREANSLKLRCDDLMNDGGDNMDKCIENLGSIEISFTAADNKRKDEFSVVGKLAVQLTRPSKYIAEFWYVYSIPFL